jgi:hypothetical protein
MRFKRQGTSDAMEFRMIDGTPEAFNGFRVGLSGHWLKPEAKKHPLKRAESNDGVLANRSPLPQWERGIEGVRGGAGAAYAPKVLWRRCMGIPAR